MPSLIRQIFNYINSPEYLVDIDTNSEDEEYIIVSTILQVDEEIFPCDVMIDIITSQPTGTDYVRFTTFITPGMEGKNIEGLHRITDVLTYDFRGKFIYDYTDNSRDILYCTYENKKAVDKKVVMENIKHHIYVKGLLNKSIQEMTDQFGLKLKTGNSKLSKFDEQATEWAKNLLTEGVDIVEIKPEEYEE